MKKSRKGKFDVKGDEGIFLGYSYKSRGYKCLNLTTHKIVESAHVRIYRIAERSEEESKKELEDYRRFVYYELDTLPDLFEAKETSPPKIPKSPMITKLQKVKTESQRPESQKEGPELEVEDHNEDSEIHSKPVLARYVRRHHAPDQIIRDKIDGTMTRSNLKGT